MKHRIGDGLLRFRAEDRGLSLFLALLVANALALPERRWLRWVVPLLAMVALLMHWASVATHTTKRKSSKTRLAPWKLRSAPPLIHTRTLRRNSREVSADQCGHTCYSS